MPARRPQRAIGAPWATVLLSRSESDVLVVGRSCSRDLVFGSHAVSRRHARLQRAGDDWRLTDLGSTNGTFIDGVQIREALVHPGQRIRLGDSFLDLE